jgi:hypothetical protein
VIDRADELDPLGQLEFARQRLERGLVCPGAGDDQADVLGQMGQGADRQRLPLIGISAPTLTTSLPTDQMPRSGMAETSCRAAARGRAKSA